MVTIIVVSVERRGSYDVMEPESRELSVGQ